MINDDRRNQVTETESKKKMSFWKKFGIICLAAAVALFTIIIINVPNVL